MQAQAVTINKRQGQNQYYEEPIASGVRPLEMMRIPAGTFLMGSPEDELKRIDRGGPQHEVRVPQFFMAKYSVTQAQWRAVAEMSPVERKLKIDPSRFKGADRPVERVSWEDAVEFCARLSAHTGRPYRLPSEAEWEYACRAGTTTPFHFGETITTDLANYCGQDRTINKTKYSGSYGDGPKGEYREETTPVDHFDIANAFGLCDMHGNVLEWCQDILHDSYEGAPTDGSAWMTYGDDEYHILRGGSWDFNPRACRSARRDYAQPGNRDTTIGFRVVSAPPGSIT
ncbi:MAG: formylglycine-generating enzyme family protein [Leptolyngbyaceae cyanobacterium]